MNNNISNRQLNISSAGQIALNLDKKDGQDGIISQSVWEEFWKTNDSENKYKGRKEANVGQNGISVRDAMKLIMTRIFNAANSLGEEVNKIGDKWLSGIENKGQIDANTVKELNEDNPKESHQNNNSLDCAKNAMELINQNIKNIQLPQGMSAEQFAKNLKEAYEEQIADLPSKTTVADMTQSILTTAFCKGKNLSDTEKTDVQKIALRNAAKLAPNDEICGVKCSEILNNEEAAFNKLFGTQTTTSNDTVIPQNAPISTKIASILETRTANEVEPPAQLKQYVDRAVNYLTNQLNSLSKKDLQQMGISEAKRDRILEYLKNITYDNSHDSAQAIGSGIVFSIHCEDTGNLHNMVTLLMHEANHCDENYLDVYPNESEQGDLRHRNSDGTPKSNNNFKSVNTKEEEKACETLGLLTTAVLIKKGVLTGDDNYGRYGNPPHPVTSYLTNENLLKSDVESWANRQYSNYPEGINNANITIEHTKDEECNLADSVRNARPLQLQAGDIIKVGDKSYTLGGDDGIVLSPMDSIPFFQMVPQGNTKNQLLGRIVFDKLPPCEQEIDFYDKQNGSDGWIKQELSKKPVPVEVYRNGERIYTGKKY